MNTTSKSPHASETRKSRGIIFDVDGVLVDSYGAHLQSWLAVAAESGVQFTPQDFDVTFGQTSREIIRRFWGAPSPSNHKIREIDDRKEQLYRDLASCDFPAMDGAVAVLSTLCEAGFAIAVGSSGPGANVRMAVDGLGIRQVLSAIVTGDDVQRGKPDPEVFLRAAARLALAPAACLVVEDSPPGVMAARAGGMPVACLLSRGHHRDHYAACPPTVFIAHLSELTPAFVDGLLT